MAVPQVFDRNMKRLAYLDNAIAVSYSLEVNTIWTATFTMPADDKKNLYCAPLNSVEIFDGDERIDLFRIIGEDLERSDGATRFYNCEHVLAFSSVSVAATLWTNSSTYPAYPFSAAVPCAGVTADFVPEVTFGVNEATGGIFAPVALSGSGTVTIYAAEKPAGAIVLPSIKCEKAV